MNRGAGVAGSRAPAASRRVSRLLACSLVLLGGAAGVFSGWAPTSASAVPQPHGARALATAEIAEIAEASGAAETAVVADPLPGQSELPAPASREKLVLDHGHIDAFTPVLDPETPGGLRLSLKEDVTGMNVLRDPETVILHIGEAALETIPEGVVPGLSGPAYHLPLTQRPDLIWPGWETQLIVSEFPGADTGIVVSDVDGPGEVFLWSQDMFGTVTSLLGDDGFRLPATIAQPYPAHTHAAWAFTKAGTYELTVHAEVRANSGRRAETEDARYTFVVGGLDAHTSATETTVTADTSGVEPGAAVTLTADVRAEAGRTPVGAVQFRDVGTDAILGHAQLDGGTASFRTSALQPGAHRIAAEFVPSWSIDFTPSVSAPIVVEVAGERIPKPDRPDSGIVGEAELGAHPAGTAVRVTSPEASVRAGAQLSAAVTSDTLAGDWVSVWLYDEPVWLGWAQLDLSGALSVRVPADTATGERRLVVRDRGGAFVGWDRLTVAAPAESSAPRPVDPGPTGPGTVPPAPAQACLPEVTLEQGHIDAFTVSAGGGLAVLQILEDVTGHRVLREPETVLLRVRESARASIPGIPGGPEGYVLPLAQHPALIWPGWDTNRTTASGYTDVSISVTAVDGPGTVYLYTSKGAFGGWRPLLTHGGFALPGTIREATPAHTHAQWVFSAPGVYVLTAHATATRPGTGETLTTASHTYVFQVGDVPLGEVFCGMSPHGGADSALVAAAVQQAGLEAIAAAQAKDADRAPRIVRGARKASSESNGGRSEHDVALGRDAPLPVLIGVVAGGCLVLAGIAGGTVAMLRRMRDDDRAPGSATQAVSGEHER